MLNADHAGTRSMRSMLWLMALGAALAMASPEGVGAQSIATGAVHGTVEDPAGRPIEGALVTLRTVGGLAERVRSSEGDGSFTFTFLVPGGYELVAEAIGRRPLLVESIPVRGGRATTTLLVLGPGEPPFEVRDTLQHAGLPGAVGEMLAWAHGDALTSLPLAEPGLAWLTSLSAGADAAGGLEGLPARMTTLYLDGHPFQPVHHPWEDADPARTLLVPRSAVAGASLPRAADVEWLGTGGSVLALSTGVDRRGRPELFGQWSGDAVWTGNAVPGDVPAFTSLRGGGASSVALVRDTAVLHLALEGARWHRPLAPLVSDSLAGLLGEPGGELSGPGLGESTWVSGSLRFDWTLAERGALRAGLGGSMFSQALQGRPSPELGYAAGWPPTLDGTDGYAGAGLALDLDGPLALEFGADASLSRRDYQEGEVATRAVTRLVDPELEVEGDPTNGEVRRSAGGATAIAHVTSGPHRLKVGVRGEVAGHRYDLVGQDGGGFVFGNAAGVGGEGIYSERVGASAPISFVVPSAAVFGQYRWSASRRLTLTVGGRVGVSVLPVDEVRLDERWLGWTGLPNDSLPDRLTRVGGLVHAAWDPTGRRRTVLEAGHSLDDGELDPAALFEVIRDNGLGSVRRVTGDLATWPAPPAPGNGSTSATLTLLDPEIAPPRTSRVAVGLAHRFGGGTTLRLTGTVRRTELLLRRTDLNAPVVAAFVGPDGRPVQAALAAWGGVVGPAGMSWRRFDGYDAVWALNPDGWSRYRGLTAGLERAWSGGLAFVNYSFSSTTDNLVALGRGGVSARLSPGIPAAGADPWDEGRSDLDIPHRLAVGLDLPLPAPLRGALGGAYRVRSGSPFTPMVPRGLDVNGDGSWANDVAWIPGTGGAEELARAAGCADVQAGAFPERNACRGSAVHHVDLRLSLGPLKIGGAGLELTAELLNATDQEEGGRDEALLALDPLAPVTVHDGRTLVGYRLNPGFGSIRVRTDPGRRLHLGVRIGAFR